MAPLPPTDMRALFAWLFRGRQAGTRFTQVQRETKNAGKKFGYSRVK